MTYGKITDEGVEDLRRRLGSYYRGGQALRVLSKDILSSCALETGVRNPLYFDEEYSRKTRYGSMIGFPLVLINVKGGAGTNIGGLPGVQAYHVGDDWDFYHVLRPGDQIGATYRCVKVEEKMGKYAGRMILVSGENTYINQRDEVVARVTRPSARTERATARKKGKYTKDMEVTRYTKEELEEIQSSWDRVEIRGATPRYWEDVNLEDELPPLVKGPLRKADIAFFRPGPGEVAGVGGQTRGAHWYTIESFIKHPGMAAGDTKAGHAEHPHAGHWQEDMAKTLGIPGVYDLGQQRGWWMLETVFNWMGDDAFVRKFRYGLPRFNVEGNTTWIRGKVTKKWKEGCKHIVKCELYGQDQKGNNNVNGYAEVILPSRYPGFEVPM